MASQSTIRSSKETLDSEISMRLLTTIEDDELLSQRSLALRLGIAVGLANTYLKRCVRKGWIKVQQAPARRYAYYLTPAGFAEKTRLVGDFLTSSLGFFRKARAQYVDCIAACGRRDWHRVALVGDGDLAEIATLAARELPVELVAVIAPGSNMATSAGLPVFTSLENAQDFDAVILTDAAAPQATYEALREWIPEERIFAPEILRLTRRNAQSGEEKEPGR